MEQRHPRWHAQAYCWGRAVERCSSCPNGRQILVHGIHDPRAVRAVTALIPHYWFTAAACSSHTPAFGRLAVRGIGSVTAVRTAVDRER